MGAIDPERSQFDAFKALPRDEPIEMLNLVRFKPLAAYEAGHANAGIVPDLTPSPIYRFIAG